MTETSKKILIFAVIVAGFLLRFVAVDFGLPCLYHADEPIIVNHAMAYGSGDLNPHFFRIPPLVSYLLSALYGVFYFIGRSIRIFNNIHDFELMFYADPSLFYLIARVMFGVLLGTATIYAFFRVIARHFSVAGAVTGAFFLAVCFLHVRDSHYVYVDIPMVVVLVLALGAILQLSKCPLSIKAHATVGLWIGLAAAFKYNGIFLVLPYLLMCFRTVSWKRIFPLMLVSAGTCLALFIALNPYMLSDFQFFWREIRSESSVHQGGIGWLFVLKLMSGAVGFPIFLTAFLGIILSLLKPDVKKDCLMFFIICYYVIVVIWGQPYARYVLPLVPPMVFFAADFLVTVFGGFRRPKPVWFVIATLVLAGPTLLQSILFDRLMLQKDVRTMAAEWIEQNIPKGSKIAMDLNFLMPRLRFDPSQIEMKIEAINSEGFHSGAKNRKLEFLLQASRNHPSYVLYELSGEQPPDGDAFTLTMPKVPYDLKAIKELGIGYVVTMRVWEKDYNQRFYDSLAQKARLLVDFNPYRNQSRLWPYSHPLTGGPFFFRDILERERNGQPLKIYELK